MPRKARKRKQIVQPEFEDEIPYIPPRSEERLLIEQLSSLQAGSILCTSHGRGQLAGYLASQNPESRVVCHYLDSHYASLAQEYWEEADAPPVIMCEPDLPDEEFDVVCLPVHRQGNAELTRDLLQQAYERLKPQGQLWTAVNNPRDHWLNEQMQALFSKVTRVPKKSGIIFSGRKAGPLKKVKNFQAEFSVPFQGKVLSFVTRPGVFSHRHLDDGAWALIKSLEIRPGMQLLDLGCGCGAVGIAAMLSNRDVLVTAVDSYSRAVQCTQWNAERNLSAEELKRFRVLMTHTGKLSTNTQFDIVATNPPYFSHFQIAELFINSAKQVLKHRGKLLIVTKMPEWYEEHLPQFFENVSIWSQGAYSIVQGND